MEGIIIRNLFLKHILFFIISTLTIQAQSSNFQFLLFPHYGRSSAMSGGDIANLGDPGLAVNNPAGLNNLQSRTISLNYVDFLLDINDTYIVYATPYQFKFMDHKGFAAFHLFNINYGSITERDEFATETGRNPSANDFGLMVTWASVLADNWYYGINTKLAYSSIDRYSSSGMFFDFGIVYQFSRFYETNIAFVVKNLGFFMSKYTDSSQKIPFSLDIGFSKTLKYLPLTLNFTLANLNQGNDSNYIEMSDRWKAGLEFRVHPAVFIRAGINRIVQKSLKIENKAGFTGATLGLGFNYNEFRMDISYWNWGDAGSPLQFGLNYQF